MAITGWAALSSAGIGMKPLAAALKASSHPASTGGRELGGLYSGPMPSSKAHALVDFNVRELLGRKGTSFLDRRSALAMVACGQALQESAIQINDENRRRIGIVLGTTLGSLQSMNDYTRETLVEDRPYLVNPVLFPNTVMNCAAGQAAIRYGLKGVNATLAGGQLAFLNVLHYSANLLRNHYADVLLAGSVEEFTPHMAWANHLMERSPAALPAGEGAAVFVAQRAGQIHPTDKIDAEVLSVAVRYNLRSEAEAGRTRALESSIRNALKKAGADASDIIIVATCESEDETQDRMENDALNAVFGNRKLERIRVKRFLGECHAACGALQLAALLTWYRENPDLAGRLSLLTGWAADGGAGAAVIRGWCPCRP